MSIGFHFDDVEEALLGLTEESQYYKDQPIGAPFHESYEEYKDENDPYFDQPIGYHFDDIEWEHFVLNNKNQPHNNQPISMNENYDASKDAKVHQDIKALGTYTDYLGVTTTTITDGSTTNPITINGKPVMAKVGSIVIYGSKEFIFSTVDRILNTIVWKEFGGLSAPMDDFSDN